MAPSSSRHSETGVDVGRELPGLNASGDEVRQLRASPGRVPMVELSEPGIVAGALDQRGDAAGEGGVRGHVRDVAQERGYPLGGCARADVRHQVVVRALEGVGDDVELVPPVPVDRGLADSGPGRDGLDGERAVADRAEFLQRSLADDPPGSLDPRVDAACRCPRRPAHVRPLLALALVSEDAIVSLPTYDIVSKIRSKGGRAMPSRKVCATSFTTWTRPSISTGGTWAFMRTCTRHRRSR